jgi:hypothetical protein
MSTFIRIGNTILGNSRKNKKISILRSKSVLSDNKKFNLKKNTSMPSFQNYNSIYNSTTKYNESFNNTNNEAQKTTLNNFTNFKFNMNGTHNNYTKFMDTKNSKEFNSFNKNDYIEEANKILHQRFENKNHDLLGLKCRSKNSFFSDEKEISLNNYLIDEIKKGINNIIIKQNIQKKALINRQNEFETDYKSFLNFLEKRKIRLKRENDKLLK